MASKLVIVCSDVRLNPNLVTVTVTSYQITERYTQCTFHDWTSQDQSMCMSKQGKQMMHVHDVALGWHHQS